MAEVRITLFKDGTTEMEVDGVVGPDCTAITRRLEEALGGTIDRDYKPEWHDTVQTQEQNPN